MEIYNTKPNLRNRFLSISNLFKKLTTTKKGYIIVGMQTKAYNPKYARYVKIVERGL